MRSGGIADPVEARQRVFRSILAGGPLPPTGTPLVRATWSFLVAWGVVLAVLVFFVIGPSIENGFMFDARAYWGYPRDPLYAGPGTANGYGIYRYSPAFVPIMTLFSLVPWPVFAVGWFALLVVLYLRLSGPWWAILLAFPPMLFELYLGNVHFLLAAAIVIGFHHPAAWAFVLLTKVTPGVGVLWFAVRREWRSLGIALGVTAAIVAIGVVVAPAAWAEWVRSLQQTEPSIGPNLIPFPLGVRVVVAAAIVTWGALTDRRWTVVLAATLALPTLWSHGWAMLVGMVPLVAVSALAERGPRRVDSLAERSAVSLPTGAPPGPA